MCTILPHAYTISVNYKLCSSSEWIAELLHDHLDLPLNDLWTSKTHSIRDIIMLDISSYFQLPVNLVFVQDSPIAGTKKHAIAQANQDRLSEFIKDVVTSLGFQFHVVNF